MELIPIIEYTLLIFIAILAVVILFSYLANKFSNKEETAIPAYQNVRSSNPRSNYQENPNYKYDALSYQDYDYQQIHHNSNNFNTNNLSEYAYTPQKTITKRFTLLNEVNTGLPVIDENKLKIIGQSHGSAAVSNRTVLFK